MPEDNDEFRIQLKVADKPYPIFCKRSEEGLYRKATTAINEKVHQYELKFPAAKLETRDLLAMAAVDVSIENLSGKRKEDASPLLERLELLGKEMEAYLQSFQSVRLN